MKPKRLIYGVGVNDADYVVEKREMNGYVDGKRNRRHVWACPYFQTWKNMLKRCYAKKSQEHYPTYAGCTVSEDWHTFTNFRAWMEKQNFEGLQLDKDILVKGNQVYSPETCMFVTQMVNKFAIDSGATRGEWMIGVCWHKTREKFQANCRNPFTKKRDFLGYFDCEKEAHEAWRKRKNELAHKLAEIQTDTRVAEALRKRYSNH